MEIGRMPIECTVDRGIREKILKIISENPDYAWLVIDTTFVKCHQHAAGARRGNQQMSVSKGGSVRYRWCRSCLCKG
jgi:hypothetical protein